MLCVICRKEIKDYSHELNNMKIDEVTSADICHDCIQRFFKWQQEIYAKLFPTKLAKKMSSKK